MYHICVSVLNLQKAVCGSRHALWTGGNLRIFIQLVLSNSDEISSHWQVQGCSFSMWRWRDCHLPECRKCSHISRLWNLGPCDSWSVPWQKAPLRQHAFKCMLTPLLLFVNVLFWLNQLCAACVSLTSFS